MVACKFTVVSELTEEGAFIVKCYRVVVAEDIDRAFHVHVGGLA